MDPYGKIPDLYDLEHDAFDDDLAFYANAVTQGPVLEIGCGTGRLTRVLAETGLEIYGIDSSEAMLTKARERLSGLTNVHLVHASADELDLPIEFHTAIWPLNVLWHFPSLAEQLHAMRSVRRQCADGAVLLVDLSNPLSMADRDGQGECRLRFERECGETQVQGFSSAEDDSARQSLRLTIWFDVWTSEGTVRRTHTTLNLRYIYRSELELMLGAAGFRIQQVYGSYDLEAYSTASPNLLAVAAAVRSG
ncbi:MAG TPA: class I SAM-dependent methyltransferase [Chloroflexota bacterium]